MSEDLRIFAANLTPDTCRQDKERNLFLFHGHEEEYGNIFKRILK